MVSRWLDEAWQPAQPNPNAMVLATATPDGQPSRARGAVQGHRAATRGISCSTRTTSRARVGSSPQNPRAAAVMHWDALHRQVRVEGPVRAGPAADSDAYFASRPGRAASAPGPARRASRSPRARQLLRERRRARRSASARRYPAPGGGRGGGRLRHSAAAALGRLSPVGGSGGAVGARERRACTIARAGTRTLTPQADGAFRGGPWTATRLQP